MLSFRRVGFRLFALVSTFAFSLMASSTIHIAHARIYKGEPVPLGNGVARVVVAASSAGRPASVSVVLSPAALDGLPAAASHRETWEYVLPMPSDGPRTGYDHVGLNWNPTGHPPAGIYSVPHFDIHFYLISRAEQEAVTFQGAAAKPFLAPPDRTLVPEGYVVPADSAVEKMGYHGIDTKSHEFHGKAFDHTFLYGYYGGRLIFVEPMVTLAYLKSRPDITAPVRTPQSYSIAAHYPSKYRIGFDVKRNEYRLSLLGLKAFSPSARSAAR